MNILVILAHPAPGSLNHAIADAAVERLKGNGHHVVFHDLCAEDFPPVLPAAEIPRTDDLDPVIEAHCRQLQEADGIIVVHPNWWGMPPAILTGWVDRVFRPGLAYEFVGEDGGEGVPVGLLKARAALVFNTSNTEVRREAEVFGDPLERIWRDCVFGLCGVRQFHRTMFGIVCTSDAEERQRWLQDVSDTVDRHFPDRGWRGQD